MCPRGRTRLVVRTTLIRRERCDQRLPLIRRERLAQKTNAIREKNLLKTSRLIQTGGLLHPIVTRIVLTKGVCRHRDLSSNGPTSGPGSAASASPKSPCP
jgi:hypothetical protein